jgi:hypothetical protein
MQVRGLAHVEMGKISLLSVLQLHAYEALHHAASWKYRSIIITARNEYSLLMSQSFTYT